MHRFLTWPPIPGLQFVLLLLLCTPLTVWAIDRLWRRSPQAAASVLRAAMVGASCLAVLVLAGAIGIYLQSGVLNDHVESWNVGVFWNWAHGGALYHAGDAPVRYSTPYGPGLYLGAGTVLGPLGPSPTAWKTLNALLLPAGFVLVLRTCPPCSWFAIVVSAGYYALALTRTVFLPAAFWLRAEPFLIFCVAVAVVGCQVRSRRAALLLVAAALAAATAMKPHAALYVAPAMTVLLTRFGWKTAALAALIAGGGVGLCFTALPNVSLWNYLDELALTARHGLDPGHFIRCLGFLAAVIAPLALFGIWRLKVERCTAREAFQADFSILATLLMCVLVVLVPASKDGAGSYHLLPFLPWCVAICLRQTAQLRPPEMWCTRPAIVLAALASVSLVWMLANEIYRTEKFVRDIQRRAIAERGAVEELAEILQRYPDRRLAMGLGSHDSDPEFALTFHKWLLIAAGQPLLLDAGALMDYEFSGKPLTASDVEALTDGSVGAWIVPRGEAPFSMTNYYGKSRPLVPDEFRRRFLSNFRKDFATSHYDVWLYATEQQTGSSDAS